MHRRLFTWDKWKDGKTKRMPDELNEILIPTACECFTVNAAGEKYLDLFGLCEFCWEKFNKDFYEKQLTTSETVI